ncbi:MAG: hypothetical protein HYW16_00170, partial [Candidatus Rokubacteria bacterium]|nr:hypothetical protein [Candidatus Rokubacteria bacterium]
MSRCASWPRTPASSPPITSQRRSAPTPTAVASATPPWRGRRSSPSPCSSGRRASTGPRFRSTPRCAPKPTAKDRPASSGPSRSIRASPPGAGSQTSSTPSARRSAHSMPSRLASLIRRARRLSGERDRLVESLAREWGLPEVEERRRGRGLSGALFRQQVQVVLEGGRIPQETRGWVEERGVTVSQRSKEQAHDYRYFPEPDLPPLVVSRDWVAELRARLPELPEARYKRFVQVYGLPEDDADQLVAEKKL